MKNLITAITELQKIKNTPPVKRCAKNIPPMDENYIGLLSGPTEASPWGGLTNENLSTILGELAEDLKDLQAE